MKEDLLNATIRGSTFHDGTATRNPTQQWVNLLTLVFLDIYMSKYARRRNDVELSENEGRVSKHREHVFLTRPTACLIRSSFPPLYLTCAHLLGYKLWEASPSTTPPLAQPLPVPGRSLFSGLCLNSNGLKDTFRFQPGMSFLIGQSECWPLTLQQRKLVVACFFYISTLGIHNKTRNKWGVLSWLCFGW